VGGGVDPCPGEGCGFVDETRQRSHFGGGGTRGKVIWGSLLLCAGFFVPIKHFEPPPGSLVWRSAQERQTGMAGSRFGLKKKGTKFVTQRSITKPLVGFFG